MLLVEQGQAAPAEGQVFAVRGKDRAENLERALEEVFSPRQLAPAQVDIAEQGLGAGHRHVLGAKGGFEDREAPFQERNGLVEIPRVPVESRQTVERVRHARVIRALRLLPDRQCTAIERVGFIDAGPCDGPARPGSPGSWPPWGARRPG